MSDFRGAFPGRRKHFPVGISEGNLPISERRFGRNSLRMKPRRDKEITENQTSRDAKCASWHKMNTSKPQLF